MSQLYGQDNKTTEMRFQEELKLSNREKQEITQLIRPSALVIHETVRLEGEIQLLRPISALFWSGLAAGLSMGFSLVAQGLLRAHLPHQSWSAIIESFGYSIGFVIVIMGRQQLFTENTLTAILPFFSNISRAVFMRVLRLWVIVLMSNLIGALGFAFIVGHIEIFESDVQQEFTKIGLEALKGGFLETFLQAIFAGWLIALMVWLLPAAESSPLWVIVFITSLVGLGELPHIIAGSVEVLYAVTTGVISWGVYFSQFMLPALMGNIIGGVSLVAALNHAQVAPSKS